MSVIIQGYEYDIFISYRHNDNLDGWVTDFVLNLERELKGTIKEPVSIYFDTNPHDGLLETHNVGKSLESKIRCLIFIPIISRTYCDTKSFAWQHEFCAFNKMAGEDAFGMDIKLTYGNVSSRILPVKIHELPQEDSSLLENELGGNLRSIDFIYREPGVNRPLRPSDSKNDNQGKTDYKNQLNKSANAISEIIRSIRNTDISANDASYDKPLSSKTRKLPFRKKLAGRNVLRASVVYILTALIIWKIAAIGSDLLNLSENIIKLLTLVLVVLFPFAILLAWLYERSPDGFIRTGSDASMQNPFKDEQKKPFTSVTFISLLLVTTIALFLLFPISARTDSPSGTAGSAKSIAVLPFDNMSNDPEQEYFSNGMMQEILNHLFMIGGLKIPSGTSSLRFKGTRLSVREIARELKVSYILEGNVSRSGNNVRIIVRLIDGNNEQLLWTEDYKRTMTAINLLEIQSDVAQHVADNMKIVINPEVKQRIEAKPTLNTEAYTLFLQSDNFLPFEQAKANLEKAIVLDPEFADAYALLAKYWLYEGGHGGDLERDLVLEKAKPLIEKALQLDRNSPLAHTVMATLSLYYNWDFESVEKEFQIYNELNPSNSDLKGFFSDYLLASGKFQEAFDLTENAFMQNKNSVSNWVQMALAYYYNDQSDNALETIETTQQLYPDNDFVITNSLRLFVYEAKYEKAIELFEKRNADIPLDNILPYDLGEIGIAYYKSGMIKQSGDILDALLAKSRLSAVGSPSFFAAGVYTAMGEDDKALQMLDKAYNDHEVEMYWLKVEPNFSHLHGNPHFENLLKKIGLK